MTGFPVAPGELVDTTWLNAVMGQKIWDSIDAGVSLTGGLASVTTPTLPTGFDHLHIVASTVSNQASLPYLAVRFNGDAAAHYWTLVTLNNNAAVSGTTSYGGTAALIGVCGWTTGFPSSTVATIHRYSEAVYHSFDGMGRGTTNTPTLQHITSGGYWNQASAITALTFLPTVGGFESGRITVYGMTG